MTCYWVEVDEPWNVLTSELFTLTAEPGLPWIPGCPVSPLLPLKDNIQKVTPQSHMVTSSYTGCILTFLIHHYSLKFSQTTQVLPSRTNSSLFCQFINLVLKAKSANEHDTTPDGTENISTEIPLTRPMSAWFRSAGEGITGVSVCFWEITNAQK